MSFLVVVLALLCSVSFTWGQNLVLNPGFESQPNGLQGYTVDPSVFISTGSTDPPLSPRSGSQFAFVNSPISKTVTVQVTSQPVPAGSTITQWCVFFHYAVSSLTPSIDSLTFSYYITPSGGAAGTPVSVTVPPASAVDMYVLSEASGITLSPGDTVTLLIGIAAGAPVPGDVNVGIDDLGVVPFVKGKCVGDPVFTGFHGQIFSVTGLPDHVFNLLSLPSLQLNALFISLTQGQSMTELQMKRARLLRDVQLTTSPALSPLPSTKAWGHNGTYIGAVGVQLPGARLHVVAGRYTHGFAAVTMNGNSVLASDVPVRLADGITMMRRTAHEIVVVTPIVAFTVVNSDNFLNIDNAALLDGYSAGVVVGGLLGQTADVDWKVEKSAHWKRHMEEDYMIPSGDLFSHDAAGSPYNK